METLSIEPRKSNGLLCFCQIKNDTLAGFFWFFGCRNVIMNAEFQIMNGGGFENV
jgi:hypothetical protein